MEEGEGVGEGEGVLDGDAAVAGAAEAAEEGAAAQGFAQVARQGTYVRAFRAVHPHHRRRQIVRGYIRNVDPVVPLILRTGL